MTLMQRRRALMAGKKGGGGIPAEYQEVEYIGYSTRYSYLITPILASNMTHIIADIAKTSLPESNSGSVFPSAFGTPSSSSPSGNYWGTLENISGSKFTANPSHTKTQTFDRTRITSTKDASSGNYIGLGYNSTAFCPGLNFYTMKIYNSTTLLFDGVPCYRKSDNKIGFYDMVSEIFCPVSGWGTWTKGADV